MPKTKKRGKGNRADKEKPLLTVQGVLRLEKCFVQEQHEGAEVMEIRRHDGAAKEKIRLVPGKSEHDLVEYKKGYDIGPSNPNPQNEPERHIFEQQRKVDEANEAFEDMKKKSEEERKAREEKFKLEEEMKRKALGLDKEELPPPPVVYDPDDPSSYLPPTVPAVPGHVHSEPGFHNNSPLAFGEVLPPGDEETALTQQHLLEKPVLAKDSDASLTVTVDENLSSNEETQLVPDDLLPTMKPLPQQSSSSYVHPTFKPEAAKEQPEADPPETESPATQSPGPSARQSENEDSQQELPIRDMALEVAMEMEVRRGMKRKADDDEEPDKNAYSLDELTFFQQKEEESRVEGQGPEISEAQMAESAREQPGYDPKVILEQYWAFVRENPQDFNGWTYLISHAETIDVLEEIRAVYKEFLELYPYCYAYWSRYSDIEKKHGNWQRALAILHRALDGIPLSIDLWIHYLELYHKMYQSSKDFDVEFTKQCEKAIQTVGLDYRSDLLWERYLEWETERKNFRHVTSVYRRLIAIPTRLYNKHWDNFIAHVRDHHPRDILAYDEYEELRKMTCKELDLKYRPDPVIHPETTREVVFPEDKLKAGMKERIVAHVVSDHEKCDEEVDKRFKYEEKIKRTYFHVKPMDQKQLKNWDNYLDFEIEEGDHERIIVLFERCLIPCAYYEQFWAKYARYLESHFKAMEKDPSKVKDKQISDLDLRKARWSFGTGLTNVDDLRDKRCTWTLRGWKETDEEGNEIMVAEESSKTKDDENKENKKEEAVPGGLVPNSNQERMENDRVESEMSEVLKTTVTWMSRGIETVRKIYERACIVHCPKKAMIKMKWAAFEEECGDVGRAKEILLELRNKYPLLLECRIQLIDIERRLGRVEEAEKQYKLLLKRIDEPYKKELKRMPQHRKKLRTWVAMKYARFLFKVCGQEKEKEERVKAAVMQIEKAEDLMAAVAELKKALEKKEERIKAAKGVLKKALMIEPTNPALYSQLVEICYQTVGVSPAIELALGSPHLTNMQKLEFVKRKAEYMQEFGDIQKYRDATEQLKHYKKLCAADLKAEARKKRESDKEDLKDKERENIRQQVLAEINVKAKIAEAEGRLLCSSCQGSMIPNADGVYEFEHFRPGAQNGGAAGGARDDEERDEAEEDAVIDLLDMVIPEEEEQVIKKNLEEKTKYKEVAPTWELNIETYSSGYGKKRKVYDPDYQHIEQSKYKEYERLETGGYSEDKVDPDRDKLRNIHAPGLGAPKPGQPRPREENPATKYTSSDYVIPPKVPQLQMGPGIGPVKPNEAPGIEQDTTVFELPPEIADPQKSPCVNVPEWFVKEGGELCLSDTANGMSVIRYWPKFLSEKGNTLMFNRLRKYCKWHQKQVKISGEWKYETRLVAWYGPCDYNYAGLTLDKNPNWAPELLDLLHRLIAMTRHEYNSCFLNLYRHGHDMCGWHADVHPQLGRNPPVASVSLGAVRVFEFRKKKGAPNFIRFPLFPGSLLLMEGATQEDWLHSLPRDVNCKEERINLTFRIMYSVDKRH